MKRLTVFLTLAVLLVAATANAQVAAAGKGKPNPGPPRVFSDDFSDGDLVGWFVDYGNWRIEDGALHALPLTPQDVSDYKLILIDGLEVGTFSMEVWINPVANGGTVAFWRQGWPTQVEVGLSYYTQDLVIGEVVDTQVISEYHYGGSWEPYRWYKLRVDGNGKTGEVRVWVDDVFRFSHTVQLIKPVGKIGLHSTATGSMFDNVHLQWRK